MRHLTQYITPVLLLATFAMVGCDNTSASDVQPMPIRDTPVTTPPQPHEAPATPVQTSTIADDSNAFAMDLFQTLARKEGNLFFSPSSIHTALAMTYVGAANRTAEQMASTLHYPPQSGELHAAYEALIASINDAPVDHEGNPTYQLSIANALWGQAGFAFEADFMAINEAHYGAQVNTLDFARDADGSRQTINRWVEEQTNDKIKDLLSPGSLDQYTRLVLTNAIYFKGNWAEQFTYGLTQDGAFHTGDRTLTLPMMRDDKYGSLLEGDTFRAATLPYEGGRLTMTIYLPNDRDGLPALEKRMTLENLTAWQSQFKPAYIGWRLPRWKFSSEFSLAQTLAAMGMPDAFTNAADFSAMSSQDKLQISAVVHKAFVAVDEKGTEAAAATAVTATATSASPITAVPFVVDHPFLFTIRHEPTGTILFMGRVVHPAE